jgi:hypothetical protein
MIPHILKKEFTAVGGADIMIETNRDEYLF